MLRTPPLIPEVEAPVVGAPFGEVLWAPLLQAVRPTQTTATMPVAAKVFLMNDLPRDG
jgi:hypothetical protein